MSTKTYWVYYENDKEEKFSQDDLEKMFASNQGLAEQKKEGTTFETWLSEMEIMQILNRHCCEISLNKIADMKDQMDSWEKATRGYAAMMLDRSNGDMWVDYFPKRIPLRIIIRLRSLRSRSQTSYMKPPKTTPLQKRRSMMRSSNGAPRKEKNVSFPMKP